MPAPPKARAWPRRRAYRWWPQGHELALLLGEPVLEPVEHAVDLVHAIAPEGGVEVDGGDVTGDEVLDQSVSGWVVTGAAMGS